MVFHTVTVIDAGFCAPSASNKRPWHFIILRDRDTLQKLSDRTSHIKMLSNADCCIVVCGDQVVQGTVGLLIADCSAAIQNMLLAAHGLGLGAVWCGLYGANKELADIDEILGLPPKVLPVGLIAVGYPAEKHQPHERFEKAKVHYEK